MSFSASNQPTATMKTSLFKYTYLLAFLSMTATSFAQDTTSNARYIEVSGSAEMKVKPDLIYLNIMLREYADGSRNIELKSLENGLLKALKNQGIHQEALEIINVQGYNWQRDKKRADFKAGKSYRLKLNSLDKINPVLADLDPKGIEYINIEEATHTRIEEHKLTLKGEAIKNAREKAEYLVEQADASLGKIMRISENGFRDPVMPMMKNYAMRAESMDMTQDFDPVQIREIVLREEISAVFYIE